MNRIELGKKYAQRGGLVTEVLKIDAAGIYPVVVLVKYSDGTDCIVRLTEYGRDWAGPGPLNSSNDLLELPKQYAGWVNVYELVTGFIRCGRIYGSREELPESPESGSRLIARLRVEFTEGQDLCSRNS